MKVADLILNIFSLLLIRLVKLSGAQKLYVCEAENASFLGEYVPGHQKIDGVEVYSNEQDMSFFRNRGFWYLGNLSPWPPETHYRCVEPEGCNVGKEVPPTSSEGAWKGNRKFNSEKPPVISATPCGSESNSSGGSSEEL